MTNAEKLQARSASLAREKGSKALQFTVIIREGEIVAFVETDLGHVHGLKLRDCGCCPETRK